MNSRDLNLQLHFLALELPDSDPPNDEPPDTDVPPPTRDDPPGEPLP